jgi:hypothetical protein
MASHFPHSGARHLFAGLLLWATHVRERGSHARAAPAPRVMDALPKSRRCHTLPRPELHSALASSRFSSLYFARQPLQSSPRHGRHGRARPRRVPAAQPFLFPSHQCHHIPLTAPPLPHSPVGHATPRSAGAASHRRPGRRRAWPGRVGPPRCEPRLPTGAQGPPVAPPLLVAINCCLSGRIPQAPTTSLFKISVRDLLQKFDESQGSNCKVSDSDE